MRLTIKYLQEQLENEKSEKTKYYRLWRELEDKEKKENERKMYDFRIKEERDSWEIYRLTRIIDSLISSEYLLKEIEIKRDNPHNFPR